MIQREDIVLLVGTALGLTAVAGGHVIGNPQLVDAGIYLMGGGLVGKSIVPAIAPGQVVQSPPVVQTTVTGSDGKVYVKQPDGSLKPQ